MFKKKNAKYLILIMILLLAGCRSVPKLSPIEKEVNSLIRNFAKEMQAQYQLQYIGDGGNLNGGIQNIKVIFTICSHLTIAEARYLEVNATERLLELINCNEKLRPYLAEYPFPVGRAMVTISTERADGSWAVDGSVVHILTAHNKIHYAAAKLETYTTQPPIIVSGELDFEFTPHTMIEAVLVPLYEESYEEALWIVKEKCKIPCE